eukprot:g1412.t1
MVMQQIKELCESLGIQYEDENIPGTFIKIKDVLREHQQTSENERQRRNHVEINIRELQQKLELTEREKSGLEGRISLGQQQAMEQEELIRKANTPLTHFCVIFALEMESRLLLALNEEKKRRISAENAFLEAESKSNKESSLRRKTELNYQDAVATLDKQRTLLKQTDQERIELQTIIKQLENDKEHLETKCSTLCDIGRQGTKLDDVLMPSLDEIHSLSDHLQGKQPAEHSMPHYEFNQWSGIDREGLGYRENKNIANSLVLPPIASQFAEMSMSYRGVGNLGHSVNRIRRFPREGAEGISIRKTDHQRSRYSPNLPSSVVSGPLVYNNNSFGRNNNQISLGNLSPMSVGLVLNSETSDSATVEDLGIETGGVIYHHHHQLQQQQLGLRSHNYGPASSTVPYSEDYDSVNSNVSTQIQHHHHHHRWVNPLQWAWERKGNVVGGVTSGVQSAAKTGVKMSRSFWTWVTVLAVTAGGTIGVNRSGEIADEDFSDIEEVDSSSNSHQANDFIG